MWCVVAHVVWIWRSRHEPFYGKSQALPAYTCRGEAQNGTTHFWRIASLYVVWRCVRLTLALTYVLPKESTLSVVQRLLSRRTALGLRAKVLYLDKGFCSTAVIQYLQEANEPAVLAGAVRGQPSKGGARAPCRGRKAYRTIYTFSDGTSADLAVVPTLKRDKKTHRQRRVWTGRSSKSNTVTADALALKPPIANWVSGTLTPIRAMSLCAFSS